MTRMLRGSCTRIRMARLRMRMRISVLGFASNRPRAPRNSADNLPTFITRSFYKNNRVMYSLDIIDDKHKHAFINIKANEEYVLISAYEDGNIARSLFYIDKQRLKSLIKALSAVNLLLK